MVWKQPNDPAPESHSPAILTLPVVESVDGTETSECPSCRRGSLWREPLLLLAIGAVLVMWVRDVQSRTELRHTDSELDLAIRGHGHFQVLRPNGEFAYSRFGRFSLNENRQLVTAEGHLLQPAITVPADTQSITVGSDGVVSVVQRSAPNAGTIIGELQPFLFANPDGLAAIEPGRPYYSETLESGVPIAHRPGQQGLGVILQGWLEGAAWYSDGSFLRLAVGLGLILLGRFIVELRRQRRQLQRLVDQLSHARTVSVQEGRQAA